MIINIYLYSKNYNSLKIFLSLFYKLCLDNSLKLKQFSSQFQKKKKKKFFTVLKSPHVNKRAQDHFEYCLYKKQISLYSFNLFKFLIILKKIQSKIFSDVRVKIKFLLKNKNLNNSVKKQLNFNIKNYKLDLNNYLKVLKLILFYLNFFDMYGEIAFKKDF